MLILYTELASLLLSLDELEVRMHAGRTGGWMILLYIIYAEGYIFACSSFLVVDG